MTYIKTLNNNIFDYKNIKENKVDIKEIAAVLSKIPRWLGHTEKFYSVAQHCCWCYDNTQGNKLEALMHDASEAYVGDCPTPLKALLPNYKKIEAHISVLLSNKFKFNYPYSKETHDIDSYALEYERHFIRNLDKNYKPLEKKPFIVIDYWSPKKAEKEFLKRFKKEFKK